MSTDLSEFGKTTTDRLGMHVGLMVSLLQNGAPLSLVQMQCQSLRQMLKEVIDLDDEPSSAFVHLTQLIPDDVAAAMTDHIEVPDNLAWFDDEPEAFDPDDAHDNPWDGS